MTTPLPCLGSIDLNRLKTPNRDILNLSSSLTMEELLRHPTFPWNRAGLSENPYLTLSVYTGDTQVLPGLTGEWDYTRIFCRFTPTLDEAKGLLVFPKDLMVNRGLPRRLEGLTSLHKFALLDHRYGEHLHGSWPWSYIALTVLDTEDVDRLRKIAPNLSCFTKPWEVCYTNGISVEKIVQTCPDDVNRISWYDLTRRARPETILQNLHLPWAWDILLENQYLSVDLCRLYYEKIQPGRRLMFGKRFLRKIAPFIQRDELFKIPNYESLFWSRGLLCRNKSMSRYWLETVVDKWPNVWGKFDYEQLELGTGADGHGSAIGWSCHLDSKGFVTNMRAIYFCHWFHNRGRHHNQDLLQEKVLHTKGVNLSDIFRFFPDLRSQHPFLVDRSYHDVDLFCW